MTLTTYKWSIEEWHDLVNSGVLTGKKVELLAGEIIEMSPEGISHRNTNHKVVKYFVLF
jgi:Uma2 family endonuclease